MKLTLAALLLLTGYGVVDAVYSSDNVVDRSSSPYVELLHETQKFPCGGVLISSKWVLTGTHPGCVTRTTVQAGSTKFNVTSNVTHSDGSLMLLELDGEASNPSAALGEEPVEVITGTEATFLGLDSGGTTLRWHTDADFTTLKQGTGVLTEFISDGTEGRWSKTCEKQRKKVDETCWETEYGGRPCDGDRGGPVLVDNKLAAIVAVGSLCKKSDEAGIRLVLLTEAKLDWIRGTTGSQKGPMFLNVNAAVHLSASMAAGAVIVGLTQWL